MAQYFRKSYINQDFDTDSKIRCNTVPPVSIAPYAYSTQVAPQRCESFQSNGRRHGDPPDLLEKGCVPPAAVDRLRTALNNDWFAFKPAHLDLPVAAALCFIARETVPDLPTSVIAETALALAGPLGTGEAQIRAANLDTFW